MSAADVIEATVVTLTAEVRTLYVGNRQVTLSVAQQLDIVDLLDVEPMGRVRIARDKSGRREWVIGKHVNDGTLVLAEMAGRRRPPDFVYLDQGVLPDSDDDFRVSVCEVWLATAGFGFFHEGKFYQPMFRNLTRSRLPSGWGYDDYYRANVSRSHRAPDLCLSDELIRRVPCPWDHDRAWHESQDYCGLAVSLMLSVSQPFSDPPILFRFFGTRARIEESNIHMIAGRYVHYAPKKDEERTRWVKSQDLPLIVLAGLGR